jgi:hypothetical protein
MKNPWFEIAKILNSALWDAPSGEWGSRNRSSDLFNQMMEAEESFEYGEMVFPGYYNDYPTEKIGGNNPYSQCRFCGRSTPEINGDLEGHLDFCQYKINKKQELKDKFLMEILNEK